jgi:hypothetical protein
VGQIRIPKSTRGVWKIGARRGDAKYAMAVFDGVVQEVYKISGWFPGGNTLSTRDDTNDPDRWEFVGRRAPEAVRKLYIFKAVRNYFRAGARNPIRYISLE